MARDVHREKAPFLIPVTEGGRVIDVRDQQP
eukprot:CAMPEP_0185732894 /NCGR_PEP_ID=MMETSP1171-20130828/17855_1 /TAXON_ID=374046 /ORGANISM="Helicotheca tamensis, Strain CCMP826" /LENGTH=30 /DNA_ID= /DNA_START= /DNA_END= /DNA_ORIENTATION=